MQSKLLISTLLMILLIVIGPASSQSYENRYLEDIHARVVDINWKIDNNQFSPETTNEIIIKFNITSEIWNPHPTDAISYGSSSCPWSNNMTIINTSKDIEIQGQICTLDWTERYYKPGLTNYTSSLYVAILNETNEDLPKAQFLISGGPNEYVNSTDHYFGLNLTLPENEIILREFEDYPKNWGQILYTDSFLDRVSLPITGFSFAFIILIPVYSVFIQIKNK